MSEGYYGWANYETWCAKLWLDNDQTFYHDTVYMVNELKDEYELEKWIENQMEEYLPEVSGFTSDLLTHAFEQIDFSEIAHSFMEEYYKEDEEDEDEDEN